MPGCDDGSVRAQFVGAEYYREAEAHRDQVVREALLMAVSRLSSMSGATWYLLRRFLLSAIKLVPEDAGIGGAVDALVGRAGEIGQRGFEGPCAEKNEVRMLALVMECMSEAAPESKDPYLRWIRDNRELLDEMTNPRANKRDIIGQVMASGVSPSFFRVFRAGGLNAPQFLRFDIEDEGFQDALIDAFDAYSREVDSPGNARDGFRTLCGTFAASLGGRPPERLREFGASHVAAQLGRYRDDEHVLWILARFYRRLLSIQGFPSKLVREGVTPSLVSSPRFASWFLDGYRAVPLSPLDGVPAFDRWIVYPNGAEDGSSLDRPNDGVKVDFQRIEGPLRPLAKQWFWEADTSIAHRKQLLDCLALFCEWRDKEIAVFVNVEEPYLVKSEEVELYLKHAGRTLGKKTVLIKRGALRSFAEFLEEQGDDLVDPLCERALSMRLKGGGGNGRREPEIASREHCRLVEEELAKRSAKSLRDLLQYVGFLLIAYTDLRMSSSLSLKVSQITETATAGLYAIRRPSKTTGRDTRSRQIHPKVKRALDRAIRETQGIRDGAPRELRDYVFLVPSRKGALRVLPMPTFKYRLKALCLELGIPHYSPSAFRKRYMTDADSAVSELGLGQAALNAATGHSGPDTAPVHYIRNSDVEYYEAFYGVEIGTAKIRGRLSSSVPDGVSDEDLVASDSGWCEGDDCSASGMVSCLMCSHFRTTPSQLPAFKANVEAIDRLIARRGTDHDRGHLAAYKALNVAYICMLEAMARDMEGGCFGGDCD